MPAEASNMKFYVFITGSELQVQFLFVILLVNQLVIPHAYDKADSTSYHCENTGGK